MSQVLNDPVSARPVPGSRAAFRRPSPRRYVTARDSTGGVGERGAAGALPGAAAGWRVPGPVPPAGGPEVAAAERRPHEEQPGATRQPVSVPLLRRRRACRLREPQLAESLAGSATGRCSSRSAIWIPKATTMQWSRKTLPSMQTTRRSSSPNGRLRNDCSRLADSATNRRDTALLDVPRSATPAGVGSNVPAYRRVDTPAATADSVCSSSGSVAAAHWKLGSRTSPSALRTRSRGTPTWRPPSVTSLATLPPRHAGRST